MSSFEMVGATSWKDAVELLAAGPPGTVAKAAGMDLWDRLKEGLDTPARLVSLLGIAGGASIGVHSSQGGYIGALTTLAALADHDALRAHYPALSRAAARAANPNVRNAATLGGNLCQRVRCHYFRSALHPCVRKAGDICFAQRGDHRMHALFDNHVCAAVLPSSLAVALAALNAEVEILSATGASRRVSVETLYVSAVEDPEREVALEAGELVTGVLLPPTAPGERSAYGKVAHRDSQDWPIVEAAVALTVDKQTMVSPRVVLGAVAMTPHRSRATEEHLQGASVSPDRIARAAELCTRGSTPLEGNRYKLPVVRALVRRLLEEVTSA